MILDQGLETVTAILYSLDTAMKRAAQLLAGGGGAANSVRNILGGQ